MIRIASIALLGIILFFGALVGYAWWIRPDWQRDRVAANKPDYAAIMRTLQAAKPKPVCGEGTGITCWRIAKPYAIDRYPGQSIATGTLEASERCYAYYERYEATNVPDHQLDWWCYERNNKPKLEPDPTR